MIQRLAPFFIFFSGLMFAAERPTVIVLTGAPGSEEYGRLFSKWTEQWKEAAAKGGADFHHIDNRRKAQLRRLQKN